MKKMFHYPDRPMRKETHHVPGPTDGSPVCLFPFAIFTSNRAARVLLVPHALVQGNGENFDIHL
jgi:hypothetical protein